jgi:hypothetical protein
MYNNKTENYYLETFNKYLEKATEAITESYFELPVDGSPDPIYRERVYCYELYHQLRLQIPGDCPYSLGGEVDKTAHPKIKNMKGIANTTPDLLFHKPGSMAGNLVIIEVKPCTRSKRAFKDDLNKLSLYLKKARYKQGILLVYGEDNSKLESLAEDKTILIKYNRILNRIKLYWHEIYRRPAIQLEWKINLINQG